MDIYFIRHGETIWNREKKIQGRTNIPLSDVGIAQISRYQLPAHIHSLDWFVSPLLRARETAELLQLNACTEQALIEMNWGHWEGQQIVALRAQDPQGFAAAEAQGFDLLPPEGESPRMVAQRVNDWLAHFSAISEQSSIGCICHKGVIRAVYAQASGWSMQDKAPHKLDFHCAQHFIYEEGKWSIGELNIPL